MIPIYKPSISQKEKEYVNDCLDTAWISSRGKYVNLFEEKFAKILGVKHATSVCNGTVALHLALISLGIKERDEVIVPTLTYIASVNSILYTGATPVFVDSLEDSWQMNPEDIERKITSKTKAIMVVHLYGQSCDMKSIMEIAKRYNLFVIEDCAEAVGTKFKNNYVGTFGDVATFSFFGNKTITTGEGGMVVSNNENIISRAKHLKGQGLAKHRQYWHDVVGYNYRMTNICAAIGLAQLERLDEFIDKKRNIANFYKKSFLNTEYTFHQEIPNTLHSYWMCSILLPERINRDDFREYLDECGIETRPLFYPIHTMPMHYDKYENHPIAEKISKMGINIPSYPDLNQSELQYIVDCILKYEV